jgi:hypothetical protein
MTEEIIQQYQYHHFVRNMGGSFKNGNRINAYQDFQSVIRIDLLLDGGDLVFDLQKLAWPAIGYQA